MSKSKNVIHEGIDCLIFCEGIDAFYFLIELIRYYASEFPELEKIQIVNFGGNEELLKALMTWQNVDGFSHIKSVGIIRDSEGNLERAKSDIGRALHKAGFPVPCSNGETIANSQGVSVGYELFVNNLEELCIRILATADNQPSFKDVNDFLETYENVHGYRYARKHKNILHMYFSAGNKFVTMKIGEAAKAMAFDFKADAVKTYLDFMQNLVNY